MLSHSLFQMWKPQVCICTFYMDSTWEPQPHLEVLKLRLLEGKCCSSATKAEVLQGWDGVISKVSVLYVIRKWDVTFKCHRSRKSVSLKNTRHALEIGEKTSRGGTYVLYTITLCNVCFSLFFTPNSSFSPHSILYLVWWVEPGVTVNDSTRRAAATDR